MTKVTTLFICIFIIGGCSFGPRYERDKSIAPRPDNFINSFYEEFPEDSDELHTINRWWERLDDPLLSSYVETLLNDNLALKEASERVIQAREAITLQTGDRYPSISASGGASRSFSSNALLSNNRTYTNNYNADLNTSWEIDLFGRIKKSVEVAKDSFQASAFDQQALIHTLIADLLALRIEIATYSRLLQITHENVENRQQFYALVQNRYNLGTGGITLSDVHLAEESLHSTQTNIHRYERLLTEAIYRLDILLGKTPGTTDPLQASPSILPPPVDVPLCLPATLLDRRPDLRASELRLKASTADIGVAVADLYPSLSLGGSIGISGNDTSNLFSAEQLAGSILANLTTRIFEGGKLRANIRIKESVARELTASYADDVLNAIKEVETALKSEHELTEELLHSKKSFESLALAEKNGYDRYLRGIQSLQEFLDIKQRRYVAEQSFIQTQQEKWNTRIALYMALGGDWLGHNTEKCNTEVTSQ